ncbi:MAG TPA: aminotransferase class III-fold pyridoxal phosphate-dependent enzyme [Candidatus Limnocylindrales bacterium]|nr:aminotransferase class III-fold pyridoxal phosphate-dependent enzyme [Candidatus Limnocylindrales bacterium]
MDATSPTDLGAAAAHLTPVLGRYFERSWSHGEGHRLFDTDGRAYLDFANGIAVTALGHRHPRVTAAIHAQVDRLIGPTGAIGYAEPVVKLATMLSETLPEPIDSIMFLNSGSEAIDAALKLARRVTGRPGIIAFRGGFHGRTFGATSITTSNLNYRTGYEPLLPGVSFAPYPAAYPDFAGDPEAASEAAKVALRTLFATVISPSRVASIVIEPVLGEGGYQPAPPSFLHFLRTICDEHGILLVMDEVQTGYGRTGQMWGFQAADVVPDVVVIAKAIANGLPLSAVATSRVRMEQWGRSAHGSTYGGNPVACAAAVAVLETIADEGLIENAAARGADLVAGLDRIAAEDPRIGDVRGRGLMIGVEFVTDPETRKPDGALAKAVIARAADLGLLVLTCGMSGQVVRWIPPLDATPAEISEAVEIFGEALRTV